MKNQKNKKFNFLKSSKKQRKNGFTLIEILAVIIILAILIIIAVPAVTKYIENSRRSSYIDTAKQIIAGARNMVNDGKMDLFNSDVTYYIPISCIKSENEKKSINGKFTLAYVGVTYTGSGFEYYWTSVDEEGEGIKVLTHYDDLDEDDIESGIKLTDIDTTLSVGGRSKTYVYNNDCTELQEFDGHLVVVFDAGEGEFYGGRKTNLIKYSLPIDIKDAPVKYSHTSNISDDGEKQGNYNNNWGNANITGTDRGNLSQAHVVTISDSTRLHVKIVYGGESASWDWVCMWKGSHPDYTASSNCSSSITGQLGGGSYTSASNTKEYDVDGDTVTFSFRSDGSGIGDGYGYYAIVTGNNGAISNVDLGYEGNYEVPTREDYFFDGWEKDGKTYNEFKNVIPTDNDTYVAKWKPASTLVIQPNNGYLYVDGQYVSSSTEYTKKAGESLSYTTISRSTSQYSNGSYTTSYNANGGSSTPSSRTSTIYYNCSYSFSNWYLTGDCENVQSTSNVASTYTFPDNPGDKCTMSANWSSSCGSNWTYSFTLPTISRTGYRLIGWKSSNGALYNAGSSYTPTQSTTMTAQWERSDYNVTFNANGGTFDTGSSTYTMKYNTIPNTTTSSKYYSHTQNINDNGYKSSNYGHNWTNSNIRGTGRTSSSSNAHVITIPNATSLNVEIYYNGESCCDWATVWQGNHPSYTASSNYSSGIAQRLGGSYSNSYTVNGYTLSYVGKSTFSVPGDSVTFGFKSDGSVVGNGFGYYAIVTGNVRTLSTTPAGTYKVPTRSGYRFVGWKMSGDDTIYTDANSIHPTGDITVTAQWEVDNGSSSSGGSGGNEEYAATTVLTTAQAAGQLNQIPQTNIYIFKGGTSNQPANFLSFNNEDWRIVGIYGNQLKIIRVNSSGVPTAPSNFEYIKYNQAPQYSLGTNSGYVNSELKETLNTTYYNSLSDTAKNMIDANGNWNVGPAANNATASTAYTQSTTSSTVGSITHTTPWSGKVGLLSSYEFLYASGGGNSCLTTAGNSFSSSCGNSNVNWIKANRDLWTITPKNDNESYVLIIGASGTVGGNVVNYSVASTLTAVPVVYLKSNLKIVSGNGTSSAPYTLGI